VYFSAQIFSVPRMFKRSRVKLIATLVILLFAVNHLRAQTGLGDPVINSNFGVGSSVHGPEFPGTNNYIFSNENLPPTGSYTIINNTNVAPTVWWPTTDHTPGDGNNGYMMIVKTRASGFEVLYERLVNDLCAGTDYEFLAYVANISRNAGGVAPTLRLRIQTNTNPRVDVRPDEILSPISYNPSGAVSIPWIPILTSFTASASGSVVVSIISETTGGPSTDDLAIDDVTVKARGQKIDADFTTGSDPSSRKVCVDDPQLFTARASTPIFPNVIQWQRK
jgi:hypothetical protein